MTKIEELLFDAFHRGYNLCVAWGGKVPPGKSVEGKFVEWLGESVLRSENPYEDLNGVVVSSEITDWQRWEKRNRAEIEIDEKADKDMDNYFSSIPVKTKKIFVLPGVSVNDCVPPQPQELASGVFDALQAHLIFLNCPNRKVYGIHTDRMEVKLLLNSQEADEFFKESV